MRQGQHNRRGRGRNRKGQNSLTRSFESNGPDIKIRGTPAHIGEKYITLARDAAASGDPVLAENYLQHAEHYNRIIMAAREQQFQQGGDMNGMPRARPGGLDYDTSDDEDGGEDDDFGDQQPVQRSQEPHQRSYDNNHRNRNNDFNRGSRDRFGNNDNRGNDNRGNDSRNSDNRGNEHRGHDGPRYGADRPNRDENDASRDRHSDRANSDRNASDRDRAPVRERVRPPHATENIPEVTPPADARVDQPARRRERFQPAAQQDQQPEFLRRSVRRPRREANGSEAGETVDAGAEPVPADDSVAD